MPKIFAPPHAGIDDNVVRGEGGFVRIDDGKVRLHLAIDAPDLA